MKRSCCVGFDRLNVIERHVVTAVAGGKERPNLNNESFNN